MIGTQRTKTWRTGLKKTETPHCQNTIYYFHCMAVPVFQRVIFVFVDVFFVFKVVQVNWSWAPRPGNANGQFLYVQNALLFM